MRARLNTTNTMQLTNSIDKSTVELAGKTNEHEELDTEIKDLYLHNKEFYDKATRYREIVNRGSTIDTSIGILRKAMESRLLTMKHLKGPSHSEDVEVMELIIGENCYRVRHRATTKA